MKHITIFIFFLTACYSSYGQSNISDILSSTKAGVELPPLAARQLNLLEDKFFIEGKQVPKIFTERLTSVQLDSFRISDDKKFVSHYFHSKENLNLISFSELRSRYKEFSHKQVLFMASSLKGKKVSSEEFITTDYDKIFIDVDYIQELTFTPIVNHGEAIDFYLVNIVVAKEKVKRENPYQTIRVAKPAIYLYPQGEIKIKVEHQFKGQVINTYPEYGNGWEVIASPDGKLLNTKDNRHYNYLFWDGNYSFPASHFEYQSGFYVNKANYVDFLLSKLSILGMNDTEINDFIVYWLPELNKYERSFIHFWINDNIDNSSVLNIQPKPDTAIRIFMEFSEHRGEEKKLPEQKLPSLKRSKFTLIEWGGSEIHSNNIR